MKNNFTALAGWRAKFMGHDVNKKHEFSRQIFSYQ